MDEGFDRDRMAPPVLDPLASPERRRRRVRELRQLIARGDYQVAADLVAAAIIAEHPLLLERGDR